MYHLICEVDDNSEVVAIFPTMAEEAVKAAARAAVAGLHKREKAHGSELPLREYRGYFRLTKITVAEPAPAAKPAASYNPRRSKYWSDKWGCDTQFPNTALLQARKDAMANQQPLPSV